MRAKTQKLLKPSFKQVAARYENDKDAQAKLMQKIKHGGAGNWGQVPMPPHPQFSKAELSTLVQWVLSH